MGFCENIINVISKTGVIPPTFKITWCGKVGAYIEGAVNILGIKQDEILIAVKSGSLTIKGENLVISSCNDEDIVISGKILDIKFLERVKKWKKGV